MSALKTNDDLSLSESFTSVLTTGVFFGVFASILGVVLLAGMRWYHRQNMRWALTLAVALASLFTGAFAGALCQIISNAFTDSLSAGNPVVVTAACVLVGALLGITLAGCVPNLQPVRGFSAGLVAGVASGLCAASLAGLGFAASVFYLAGFAVLGSVLGAAIAFTERRFRGVAIEIEWEPDQTTRMGLGRKPITIGGGNDHVLIPGAPAHVSSVALKNGQIEHVETSNGKRTPLKDGSRLRVGGLVMVVHADRPPSN